MTRAKHGHAAENGRTHAESPAPAPRQSPIDFALGLMRDDSKPDALRASMAKAAMPYLYKRGEAKEHETEKAPQEEEQWSDLELARRIAYILGLAEIDATKQLKAADDATRVAQTRAQEMEQRALAAEAALARVRGDEPLPAPARYSSQHPAPISPDDARDEYIDDRFDPHPGYRWI